MGGVWIYCVSIHSHPDLVDSVMIGVGHVRDGSVASYYFCDGRKLLLLIERGDAY